MVSVRQTSPAARRGPEAPDPALRHRRPAEWGDTVGQAAFIDRSAFGVTASGEVVYAAGPRSLCTLGAVLADAGVVGAWSWTSTRCG